MQKSENVTHSKGLILWPFADFIENDDLDGLVSYLEHCRITVAATGGKYDLEKVILNHYQVGARSWDLARAARDLSPFLPSRSRA